MDEEGTWSIVYWWCSTCCRAGFFYLLLIPQVPGTSPSTYQQFDGLLIFDQFLTSTPQPQKRQTLSAGLRMPSVHRISRFWKLIISVTIGERNAEANFCWCNNLERKTEQQNIQNKRGRNDLCSLRFCLARNSHRSQKTLQKTIIMCHFPKLKTSSCDLWIAIETKNYFPTVHNKIGFWFERRYGWI